MNFQGVCFLPNLSTLIAINLSSNHFRIFECCVTFQLFVNFQIVCCLPNISTFIAIDLSSNHLCVFRQYFHNHCTWLIQLICHLIIRELSNWHHFIKIILKLNLFLIDKKFKTFWLSEYHVPKLSKQSVQIVFATKTR